MGNGSDGELTRRAAGRCVSAFFDELARWGVRETVISPGSRSTALAMAAFEMSRRWPERMTAYVDVDERSAGFFALGLAKASGRPVCLVCTSGTALANYYPAVLEAETSRVPLVVLSGDRPPLVQGLGAPQTCDQLKAYGDHVRRFTQMPLPEDSPRAVAFFRQCARETVLHALPGGVRSDDASGDAHANPACGDAQASENVSRETFVASRGCARFAGPVQVNFPFDEPLKPNLDLEDAYACGRRPAAAGDPDAPSVPKSPLLATRTALDSHAVDRLISLFRDHRTIVLAGEGSCETLSEAHELVAWARQYELPLLADPLSGLRTIDDPLVIDNYDNMFGREDCPLPTLVVRFGRYPVSKRCFRRLGEVRPLSVVVDVAETRDFNAATDLFAACTPLEFARSLMMEGTAAATGLQHEFARAWIDANDAERIRIERVENVSRETSVAPEPEGAYVREMLRLAPAGSCVFSANSMAIRALDTFWTKSDKPLAVLCNRGLSGIDGTVSTALGASRHFAQTTFLTGDFTLQHDMGALAMQRELLAVAAQEGRPAPSIVIVLLNNNGGGIFTILPQKSDEPYFERLFLAPQDISFPDVARAFRIPHRTARTPEEFSCAYQELLGTPGISIVEVDLPLEGLKERYAEYQ